ncbi:MAG: glycosyltransferase family 2 protein [Lachnospiraceae bacterium]|nr:glycosyltransferase family 2 protein [Lachnospiraceae bacterium]
MKKISVIVPVYNSIDCLERCVTSICAQTYPRLEILLIDDGSTDGTDQLCEQLAAKDARIRTYHKKNGGASSARNVGLRLADGDFLGFVDSDDYIEPYVYEEMLRVLEAGEYSVAQISRDEVDEAGNRLPDICLPPENEFFCDTETFIRELLLHRGDCSFCTKLFRREVFAWHSFPEGELNEDFRLLLEILQEISGIVILPQQGYHVVCRATSTTRTRTKDSFSRVFLDIVDNADRVQVLVDEKYPALHDCAVRFNLYQRLDYMLHVPVSQMKADNVFYQNVKQYLRKHAADTVKNPYLTKKNKIYLLLLAAAPRTVRRVHAGKMKIAGQTVDG